MELTEMEDPHQPSNPPYSLGDTVKTRLDLRDPDSEYHGIKGHITTIHIDKDGDQTERQLDAYSYSIEDLLTGKQIPVHFHHSDLVPID